MKCKIPQRQKILNQRARHVIRQQIGYCSAIVLAETWGWGDKRLNDLKRDVDAMYALYDDKYKDSYEYTQMLVGLFTDGSYPVRPGSGEKVLIGREHDIAYLCHAYQLRKRGFGIGRIQTYYKELQKRIKYYKKRFPMHREKFSALWKTDLQREVLHYDTTTMQGLHRQGCWLPLWVR